MFRESLRPMYSVSLVSTFGLAMTGSTLLAGDDREDVNRTLVVSKDKTQCPSPYSEIQQAVDAASPGATIRVCPGTYNVQVKITKPLKIAGDSGAILQPLTAAPNTTGLNSGAPVIALLLVTNTRDVSIDNLTVDGSSAAHAQNICPEDYVGVMYQNASGNLTHMAVRNIKPADFPSCDSGVGIFVQAKAGRQSVDISDSSVHDYQKSGIEIDGTAASSQVRHNYVSGLGLAATVAQNGVQISHNASATFADNFVDNHLWAGCTPTGCSDVATNILLIFGLNGDVQLTNNVAATAQAGIALSSDISNVRIQGNDVFDNKVDGILVFGNSNRIENNNVFHSELNAIDIEGTKNVVSGNTINEAFVGVFVADPANNQVGNNRFYNVVVTPTGTRPRNTAPLNNAGVSFKPSTT